MSCYYDTDGKPQTYSRKEKSLGLLCVNFLNHYTQEKVDSICLDEAACRLGVERRRIYDIVNVLESVGVLVRKAKNRYTWKGYEGIPKALEKLREAALDGEALNGVNNLANLSEIKMNDVRVCLASDSDEEEHSSNENCAPLENVKRQPGKRTMNKSSPVSVITEPSKGSSPSKCKADCRREKSLGLLTQKFVQLFLFTQAHIVSLEDAARLLLGECKESAKLKTKVRRLYDIANVLSSLNLIEKTHSAENRKPAFKWLGVKDSAKYPSKMAGKKRHFGTVLSTNTNTTAGAKTKMAWSRDDDSLEAPAVQAAKRWPTPKLVQPRCTNVVRAVYNPVALYPREGSSMPVPVPHNSTPRMPTSVTLGTSGGWREWTTDSQQTHNYSTSASVSETKSLEAGKFNRPGISSRKKAASFSFGPFCPFRLQQQCMASITTFPQSSERDQSDGECSQNLTPFPLHYQNQALEQMLGHYVNAWNSWYLQVATSATVPTPTPCDSTTEDTRIKEDIN